MTDGAKTEITSGQFVRDCYLRIKDQDRRFSITQISRISGVSVSLLKMILTGRRRVTMDQARKLRSALKLSEHELEKLEGIVLLESRMDHLGLSRRAGFFTEKKKLRHERSLDPKLGRPSWVPVILLLMCEPKWAEAIASNPAFQKRIASELKISTGQLVQVQKFIKRNYQGLLDQEDGNFLIDVSKVGNSIQQQSVAKEAVELAKAYLNSVGANSPGYFAQWVISGNVQSFDKLRADFDALVAGYLLNFDSNQSDQVLRMNIQLFPVVKKIEL